LIKMLNKAPAEENLYEKRPVTGIITNYEIPRNEDPEKQGNESLKLTIEVENKEITVFLSMAAKNWKKVELEDGSCYWQAPGFSEYGSFKLLAQKAGVIISEDIEEIPEEERKEGGQTIQIFELIPAPEILGYTIKLITRDSHDKKTGKTYKNYVCEYIGKNGKEEEKVATPAQERAAKAEKAKKPAAVVKLPPITPKLKKAEKNTKPQLTENYKSFLVAAVGDKENFAKKDLIAPALEYPWAGVEKTWFAGEDVTANVNNLYAVFETALNSGTVTVKDGRFTLPRDFDFPESETEEEEGIPGTAEYAEF
jgi:hypothetical protein